MRYRIRDGFSVVVDERTVCIGGEVVELDDEQAELHAHKLEPVEQAAAPAKSDKPAKADA